MTKPLRILVGMETSGRTRDALRARGHDAVSCDLLPTDVPGPHYQGDVFDIIGDGWDLGIFHPTCTYLCGSGLHWNKREGHVRFGGVQTELALQDVERLMAARIPNIVIENPRGCISTRIAKPSQGIQPYQFTDDASKHTDLWIIGGNLQPLRIDPQLRIPGRVVEWPRGSGKMVERWSNQTDSGQNKLPPSADRWKLRSETYWGVANLGFTQFADMLK